MVPLSEGRRDGPVPFCLVNNNHAILRHRLLELQRQGRITSRSYRKRR
jgi:hypothetical protein